MATGISRTWMRFWLSLAAILVIFQLTGCGDKEPEQRKAFMDFLQNTVMRSSGQLPALSEDQKQHFGPYAHDYAILYDFSRQANSALNEGVRPVVDELSAIHVPQDYLTHRDKLRQTGETLNTLNQRLQEARSQADSAKMALKQPDTLKNLYDQAWNKVINQPVALLNSVVPAIQALNQDVLQIGDFLQQQGAQVTFNNNGVQLATQPLVTQYNTLIARVAGKAQTLTQAQRALQNNP